MILGKQGMQGLLSSFKIVRLHLYSKETMFGVMFSCVKPWSSISTQEKLYTKNLKFHGFSISYIKEC